jgi:hypothetical protein
MKSRQFNNLEHVVIGKVVQLCRNMLHLLAGVPNYGKSNVAAFLQYPSP